MPVASLLGFIAAGSLIIAPLVASAQSKFPVPPALEGVHRIVTLGDSITQAGEGPGGYVWLLRRYLQALYGAPPALADTASASATPAAGQGIEVINAGISGHKSNDMLERFQRDVLDKKPDMVTISVGINDVWHGFYDNHPKGDGPGGVPLDAFRKNVDEMITRAQAAGVRVVVLSTTVIQEDLNSPENAKLVEYNAALRDLAKEHKALFVNYQIPFHAMITAYRTTTGARDRLLTVDGVHMNPLGNKIMAFTLMNGLGISPEARAAVHDVAEK